MPVYEYKCEKCDRDFSLEMKISEYTKKKITCPKCKSTKVKRLISRSTFILKGSGWYATDYGSKGSGGGNGRTKALEEAKEKSTSSTEKKTDSAAKSDSGGKSSDASTSSTS